MKMPQITEAICIAVNDELKRKGIKYLAEELDDFEIEQPFLFVTMVGAINHCVEKHGTLVGESVGRSFILMYKLIKTQIEVNELEEAS